MRGARISYYSSPVERDPDLPVEVMQAGMELYSLRIEKEELAGKVPDERLFAELGWLSYQLAKVGSAENPAQLSLEPPQ